MAKRSDHIGPTDHHESYEFHRTDFFCYETQANKNHLLYVFDMFFWTCLELSFQ